PRSSPSRRPLLLAAPPPRLVRRPPPGPPPFPYTTLFRSPRPRRRRLRGRAVGCAMFSTYLPPPRWVRLDPQHPWTECREPVRLGGAQPGVGDEQLEVVDVGEVREAAHAELRVDADEDAAAR